MSRPTLFRNPKDYATDELVTVLLAGELLDFNDLFGQVHQRLRDRRAYGGGEEMLRLRVYEKLQILVGQGLVRKEGKRYAADVDRLQARASTVGRLKAGGRARPRTSSSLPGPEEA